METGKQTDSIKCQCHCVKDTTDIERIFSENQRIFTGLKDQAYKAQWIGHTECMKGTNVSTSQ